MDFPEDDGDELMLSAVQAYETKSADEWDGSVEFVGSQDLNKDGTNDPEEKYLMALNANFGHSSFRPLQWKIIRSILVDKRQVGSDILNLLIDHVVFSLQRQLRHHDHGLREIAVLSISLCVHERGDAGHFPADLSHGGSSVLAEFAEDQRMSPRDSTEGQKTNL